MSERDAWLAEMWQPCRELPLGERLMKREMDRLRQRDMEHQQAEADAREAAKKSAA